MGHHSPGQSKSRRQSTRVFCVCCPHYADQLRKNLSRDRSARVPRGNATPGPWARRNCPRACVYALLTADDISGWGGRNFKSRVKTSVCGLERDATRLDRGRTGRRSTRWRGCSAMPSARCCREELARNSGAALRWSSLALMDDCPSDPQVWFRRAQAHQHVPRLGVRDSLVCQGTASLAPASIWPACRPKAG